MSGGEVGMANAEAEGGIRDTLDRPNKRLNLKKKKNNLQYFIKTMNCLTTAVSKRAKIEHTCLFQLPYVCLHRQIEYEYKNIKYYSLSGTCCSADIVYIFKPSLCSGLFLLTILRSFCVTPKRQRLRTK